MDIQLSPSLKQHCPALYPFPNSRTKHKHASILVTQPALPLNVGSQKYHCSFFVLIMSLVSAIHTSKLPQSISRRGPPSHAQTSISFPTRLPFTTVQPTPPPPLSHHITSHDGGHSQQQHSLGGVCPPLSHILACLAAICPGVFSSILPATLWLANERRVSDYLVDQVVLEDRMLELYSACSTFKIWISFVRVLLRVVCQ